MHFVSFLKCDKIEYKIKKKKKKKKKKIKILESDISGEFAKKWSKFGASFYSCLKRIGYSLQRGNFQNLFAPFLKKKSILKVLDFLYPVPVKRWHNRHQIQSNLNSSNTDGSFTMANSNSFLSPYEILPLAQENKYLGKCSYFIMKLYVVCTH